MKKRFSSDELKLLRRIQIRSKCWLELDGKMFFGSGKARLFRMIAKHGSINAGAQAMGISYRQAWQHIHQIEEALAVKLVDKHRGGARGGGSQITPLGQSLLRLYDELSRLLRHEAESHFEEMLKKELENNPIKPERNA